MQAQKPAMVKEEGLEPTAATNLMVPFEVFIERMNEMFTQIENRAYQLFEENGRQSGYDLDNWLRAESELVMKVPINMIEDTNQLLVNTRIPDFKEKEIQVHVQPDQIVISGKHETKEIENEAKTRENRELFCSIALPCEVSPDTAKAEFKDGLLTITLPKVEVTEEKS